MWQKFLEDYSRFDEWLKEAEAMAAAPDSSEVLYTKAKEEQKKFEVCWGLRKYLLQGMSTFPHWVAH